MVLDWGRRCKTLKSSGKPSALKQKPDIRGRSWKPQHSKVGPSRVCRKREAQEQRDVDIYIYIYVYMHLQTDPQIDSICIHAYVYICVCIYICVYMYMKAGFFVMTCRDVGTT